jgi:hypothetical protein
VSWQCRAAANLLQRRLAEELLVALGLLLGQAALKQL